MAARRTGVRDRSTSARAPEDESDAEGDAYRPPRSTFASKLYAAVLVFPGIFLYIYILYIALTCLLYPCSLVPFFSRNASTATAPSDTDESESGLRDAILINAALLVLFVVQHSLMASSCLKELWNLLGISAMSRLVYVFATCCSLQFIHHFWQPTPSHTLWECHGLLLTLSLEIVHGICWLSIACSLFTIDYLELLGIKQLYYSYNGFGDPLHYKSAEQQYLLRHMRHPIFTAPFILVWAVPIMTYDRLLLAVMVPLYLAWASAISALDMKYVRRQFVNKWKQLLMNSG